MWLTLLVSFLLLGGIQFVHADQFSPISTVHHNEFFLVASSSMRGRRDTMEDAHCHILPLTTKERNSAYFGVFDGHGGPNVAIVAKKRLHEFIFKQHEYNTNVSEALEKGFMEFDKTAANLFDSKGATANVVIIKGGYLYCANAGDARAVSSVGGVAQPLSIDHKPNTPAEKARIEAAGGSLVGKYIYMESTGELIGVSRALGDFNYKNNDQLPAEEQIMIALPDVQSLKISDNLEFVILACDGVWDMMTNDEAVGFVRALMANHVEPEIICEKFLEHCLEKGSTDNMTVLLVSFLRGKSYTELCDTVSPNYKHTGTEVPTNRPGLKRTIKIKKDMGNMNLNKEVQKDYSACQ